METFDSLDQLFEHVESQASTAQIVGMVKKDGERLEFSPFSCEDWIDLDPASIRKIEYLGTKPCITKDEPQHTHPLVRLTIETSENPWLKLAASLLERGASITPTIAAPRQRHLDDDCIYGYGACGGLNQQTGQFCPPGTRPCNAENYTYCRSFPECSAPLLGDHSSRRGLFGIPVGGPAGSCTNVWFDGQCYYGQNGCGRKVNLHLGSVYSVLLNPGETHRFTGLGGGCFGSFPGTATADFA